MAAFLNTCRFTPVAGGLADFAVSVAVVGFKAPSAAGAVNGRVYKWRAESTNLLQWEEFEGVYTSGTTTVSRTTILASSTGAKVNFTVAPEVFCVVLKEDLPSVEEANSFTAAQKSQLQINIGLTEARRNLLLGAIRDAKLLGAVQPIVNGVAEGFGSNDGINAGASSGYTLDTTNKRVMNTFSAGTETMIAAATGTAICDLATFLRLSAVFDGNTNQAASAAGASSSNGTTASYTYSTIRIGKDYGGSPKILTGLGVFGSNDAGYANSAGSVTITLKASNTDPATTSWTGTTIGAVSPFANTNATNSKTTLGNANTTPYRYVWAEFTGTNLAAIAEVQFYESALGSANNIILTENGYDSLDFTPTTLQVSAIIEPIDPATLNTDATMEVSRDNGANWTSAPLVQYHTLGTKVFVESAAISVAGQPSGAKPAFRYKSLNNKRVYIHGGVVSAA